MTNDTDAVTPRYTPEEVAPSHCYPCARGDHGEHKANAWEPDIPCECPPCAIPYPHGPHLVDDGRIQNPCLGSGPSGPQESVTDAALELSRQVEQEQRRAEAAEAEVERLKETLQQQPFRVAEANRLRAEDADAAIEATRDLLDAWGQDGPDDPALHLLIQRVREMLALGERFRAGREEER